MAHARVVVLPRTVLIERCEFLVYQHGILRTLLRAAAISFSHTAVHAAGHVLDD